MMEKRLYKFDNLKFLLIILVIYCHLANVGLTVSSSLYKLIYSFHMPLFIMISGYFTNKYQASFKFWDSTLAMGLLFFIFNAIMVLIYNFLETPNLSSPSIPSFALWYILCMIYWRLLIRFIPDKILCNPGFITLSFLIAITPSIINLNYLSLSRCLAFFPFFLIGWNLKNSWCGTVNKLINSNLSTKVVFFIASLASCVFSLKIPNEIYWAHLPYESTVLAIIAFKLMSWIIAISISISLFLIISDKNITNEGQHTLSYYLLHTLILFPLLDLIIPYLPFNNHIVSIVILCLIICSIHLLRKISFINKTLGIKPLSIWQSYKSKLQTN